MCQARDRAVNNVDKVLALWSLYPSGGGREHRYTRNTRAAPTGLRAQVKVSMSALGHRPGRAPLTRAPRSASSATGSDKRDEAETERFAKSN